MKGVLAWYTNPNDFNSKNIFKDPYSTGIEHAMSMIYMSLIWYLKKGVPIQLPLLNSCLFNIHSCIHA